MISLLGLHALETITAHFFAKASLLDHFKAIQYEIVKVRTYKIYT